MAGIFKPNKKKHLKKMYLHFSLVLLTNFLPVRACISGAFHALNEFGYKFLIFFLDFFFDKF